MKSPSKHSKSSNLNQNPQNKSSTSNNIKHQQLKKIAPDSAGWFSWASHEVPSATLVSVQRSPAEIRSAGGWSCVATGAKKRPVRSESPPEGRSGRHGNTKPSLEALKGWVKIGCLCIIIYMYINIYIYDIKFHSDSYYNHDYYNHHHYRCHHYYHYHYYHYYYYFYHYYYSPPARWGLSDFIRALFLRLLVLLLLLD